MRFKASKAGFRALRNSPEVMAGLTANAMRIASAAGDGMVVMPPEKGRERARVAVVTGSIEARLAEARDRALTRALGGG